MCAIMYKEYVLALLLCCNICTSISPTSTHQPKTHATHTHTHTHTHMHMCACARTHVHTHIPDQRTKTGETDVLYIYYCLTKKL
jgi:ABC-type nickel/cobalt efflux system permease component RcnA